MGYSLVDGSAAISNEQNWLSLPASDPNSPFFVPPVGTYQNNTGAIVPRSTPSQIFSTPSTQSTTNFTPEQTSAMNEDASTVAGQGISPSTVQSMATNGVLSTLAKLTVENIVFIIVGIIMIAVGLLAFKQTQTVIDLGGKAVKAAGKIGEVAAA